MTVHIPRFLCLKIELRSCPVFVLLLKSIECSDVISCSILNSIAF